MKIKGYLDKFFNSLAYYALICIVVVLCWQFDVYLVGAGIVFILGGISLFVCDDVIPFFTCLMPVMYMFKSLIIADYAPYLPFILVVFAFLLAGLVFFVVKKLKYEKVKLKTGNLFVPILISYASMFLAGSFSKSFSFLHILAMIGIGLGMTLVYLLFVNFSGKDAIKRICYMVIMVAVIVVGEMWIVYLSNGSIIEQMANKTIRVGMGEINTAAQYLALAIPCTLYLGLKSEKYDYLYLLLGLFFYANIIFTLSRTVILFATIMLPILFIYSIIKNKNKTKMLSMFIVLISLAIGVVIIFRDYVSEALSWFVKMGTNINGREELWAHCFELFKQSPFFGVGFKFIEAYEYGPAPSDLILAHNTVLQLLTSAGIIGLVGHIPFYIQKYRLLIKNTTSYKFFMLIGIIMLELFGMFDPTYINLLMTIIVYGMIANGENEPEEEKIKFTFKKEVR